MMAHMVLRIDSPKNEKIQLLRGLNETKNRRGTGLFVVEGIKLVGEAHDAGWPIAFALAQDGKQGVEPLAQRLIEAGVSVYRAGERAFIAAALMETPQGILAAVRMPAARISGCGELLSPLIMLDALQDPGNVGTILRTAEAAGFGGAVLGEGCADPFSPKVVRATMGSLFRLPIIYGCDLTAFMELKRAENWVFAGAALSGDDFFQRKLLGGNNYGLIVGNEGNGISEKVINACDRVYRLPMGGRAESLNAAVSAAIMMYDCFRNGGI